MKCQICNNHFKADDREQTICPECVSNGVDKVDDQPVMEAPTDYIPVVEEEPQPEETPTCEPVEVIFPYQVRIDNDMVYCHKGPGANHPVIGVVHKDQIQTISAEALGSGASKWGQLPSELGWISLDQCSRFTF